MHVTSVNKFHERFNPVVFNMLIDVSYSMMGLLREGVVADSINKVMLPALKGADNRQTDVLRVSLGIFSKERIRSLTRVPGYFTVKELMNRPITDDQLIIDGFNDETALFASMVKGVHSCNTAAKILRNDLHCNTVSAKLVVLTDGEETVNNAEPADIRKAMAYVNPEEVDLEVNLAYFKTGESISRKKFMGIAKECGLKEDHCHFWADHGNSAEAQKKAFRRLVKILSKPR